MKTWRYKLEWFPFAECLDNDAHTSETVTNATLLEIQETCGRCQVRPECIKWALEKEMSAVWVAGQELNDPICETHRQQMLGPVTEQRLPPEDCGDCIAARKRLVSTRRRLRKSLPLEEEARGEI